MIPTGPPSSFSGGVSHICQFSTFWCPPGLCPRPGWILSGLGPGPGSPIAFGRRPGGHCPYWAEMRNIAYVWITGRSALSIRPVPGTDPRSGVLIWANSRGLGRRVLRRLQLAFEGRFLQSLSAALQPATTWGYAVPTPIWIGHETPGESSVADTIESCQERE